MLPAIDRREDLPGRDRDREVPRRDAADDAERLAHASSPTCRAARSATVSPKARRPSPAMNLPMSIASWTSPRASVSTLPISRVIRRASSSLRSSSSSEARRMIAARDGPGSPAPVVERRPRGGDRRVDVGGVAAREDADDVVACAPGCATRSVRPDAEGRNAPLIRLPVSTASRPLSSRDLLAHRGLEDVEPRIELGLGNGERGDQPDHVAIDHRRRAPAGPRASALLADPIDERWSRARRPCMNSRPIISPSPRTSASDAISACQPRARSITWRPRRRPRSGICVAGHASR